MTPSLAPLRLLYIMPSGSMAEAGGELFALSRLLRERGEQFMGLTLQRPLPTTEIPLLDTYGMRWSYLPLPGWPMGVQRAAWRALLRRFRPDVVQFAAHIEAKAIQQVRQLSPQCLRPAYIIESRGNQPRYILPNTLVWPDLQELMTTSSHTVSDLHLNGHASAGIPMVNVTDPHDHKAVLAQCDEIERLLALFPLLRCTVLCHHPLSAAELSQLSPRLIAAVRFVQSEKDWLLAAAEAAGAIGLGGNATSARLVGAALALDLTVVLRDAPTLSVLSGLSEIKQGEAYIPRLTSLVAARSPRSSPRGADAGHLHAIWHMYRGAKLWMDAATQGKM